MRVRHVAAGALVSFCAGCMGVAVSSDAGNDDAGLAAAPDGGSASDGGMADASAADGGSQADSGTIADSGVDGGLGLFVAVGYGGRTLRSIDDGQSWIDDQWLVPQGGDDVYLLRSVAFGAGQFVAVGWRVMTSPDGRSWTDAGVMNQWLGGLFYAKDLWVAAGGYGRRTRSADGVSWNDVPFDGITNAFRGLAYDDVSARWVAVGDQAVRMSTADGIVWDAGQGDAGTALGVAAAGGGKIVAIGNGNVAVSENGGGSWSLTANLSSSDIAYAGGQFVIVGPGHVYTSADGSQWSDHPVSGIDGAIACHLTTCVVVGSNAAWRSPDLGQTWAPVTASAASSQAITHVAWGG
jgi:hypothetical protein